jgi:hypothetical protein
MGTNTTPTRHEHECERRRTDVVVGLKTPNPLSLSTVIVAYLRNCANVASLSLKFTFVGLGQYACQIPIPNSQSLMPNPCPPAALSDQEPDGGAVQRLSGKGSLRAKLLLLRPAGPISGLLRANKSIFRPDPTDEAHRRLVWGRHHRGFDTPGVCRRSAVGPSGYRWSVLRGEGDAHVPQGRHGVWSADAAPVSHFSLKNEQLRLGVPFRVRCDTPALRSTG